MKSKHSLTCVQPHKARSPVYNNLIMPKMKRAFGNGCFIFFTACCFLLHEGIVQTASATPAVISSATDSSENSAPIRPKVGEKVPDFAIRNIMNHTSPVAKISDFKGKLLVLDFWSTWCKSCLKSLAPSDSVRKSFGDRIQVLYVTYESRAVVDRFLERHPSIASRKLPIVFADTTLRKSFPHRMVPHLAWISPDGRLLETTGSFDFDRENIRTVLANQKVQFKDPKVDLMDFDSMKPLFDDGNGGAPAYLFRSMITGYMSGIGGGFSRNTENGTFRIGIRNFTVPELFKMSLDLPSYSFWKSRIVYEGLDRSKYEVENPNLDGKEKRYCYELILPANRKPEMHQIMHQNVESFFGINAKAEVRKTNCLVLKQKKGTTLLPGEGETINNLKNNDGKRKFLKNDWVSTLTDHLNDIPGMPPIIIDGVANKKVDLQLNEDLQNIPELNKALARYGLFLQKEVRDLQMLILSAPQNSHSKKMK